MVHALTLDAAKTMFLPVFNAPEEKDEAQLWCEMFLFVYRRTIVYVYMILCVYML